MSNGRVPPHDLDAEAAVLSAVLLEAGSLDRVSQIVKPEHFYSEANHRILEASIAVAARGVQPDIVSVAGELRDRERLAQVGGSAYLAQIVDAVPMVANVDTYATMVHEKWRVRQLIATCQKIAAEGYGDIGEPQEFIEKAEGEIRKISEAEQNEDEITLGECATRAYNHIATAAETGDLVRGARTGLTRLDKMLNGLQDGKLTIVAANPGMGKSVLVQTIARNVAKYSKGLCGVQIFSPEMTDEELGERALASEAAMDSKLFRTGIDQHGWQAMLTAIEALRPLPVWVTDDGDITVTKIAARMRRRKRDFDDAAKGQRVVVGIIDYLQLIDTEQKKGETHEMALGNAAKRLKRLAKSLRVHLIAISSLNRASESRPNKRPILGDLRESGAIGFHADNILLLYRESYYNAECENPDVVECNVAKQRGGPTGMLKLRFNMPESRFEDLHSWTTPEENTPEAQGAAPHWTEAVAP